jgi:hypothetical protein
MRIQPVDFSRAGRQRIFAGVKMVPGVPPLPGILATQQLIFLNERAIFGVG